MDRSDVDADPLLDGAEEVLVSLYCSEEERRSIALAPQLSAPWHAARSRRITASQFGSAAGVNRFCSPRELVSEKLWKNFRGNEATRYGMDHEDVARRLYADNINGGAARFQVREEGLTVCRAYPWLACSPDGIVRAGEDEYLLEIKCPFRKRFYRTIPDAYYAQIQGTMGIMRENGRPLDHCDFVVYTPTETQVSRFAYNERYWKEFLLPRLRDFYMNLFLPALVHYEAGSLERGEISPRCPR